MSGCDNRRARALALGKTAEHRRDGGFLAGQWALRPTVRQKLREQGVIIEEHKTPLKRRGSS